MAMNTGQVEHDGVFDYFDTAFNKHWAGPEHWKMQKAPPRKGQALDAGSGVRTDSNLLDVQTQMRRPRRHGSLVRLS